MPVFFYANTATPLTITNAAVDLATADPAAGGTLTPLLQDASGNIVSAIYTLNGQQFLSQTFDSNPYLTHDLVVAYGLLNWVTNGVFLGDYHVYATQSIDDFFIDDSEWIPSTACLADPANVRPHVARCLESAGFPCEFSGYGATGSLAEEQASRSIALAIRADHSHERCGHVREWRLDGTHGSDYLLFGKRWGGDLYGPGLLGIGGTVSHRDQHHQRRRRAQWNLDDHLGNVKSAATTPGTTTFTASIPAAPGTLALADREWG